MIVYFTKQEFENALRVIDANGQPAWECLGFIKGEYQYVIPLPPINKRIMVRSSVRWNDRSADKGEDSIRVWLEYFWPKTSEWHPLKKIGHWITRVPGWEDRLLDKIQGLVNYAIADSRSHSS